MFTDAGWSSSVARWAHNPEVAGSNPVPATTEVVRQNQRLRALVLSFLPHARDAKDVAVVLPSRSGEAQSGSGSGQRRLLELCSRGPTRFGNAGVRLFPRPRVLRSSSRAHLASLRSACQDWRRNGADRRCALNICTTERSTCTPYSCPWSTTYNAVPGELRWFHRLNVVRKGCASDGSEDPSDPTM